MMNELNTDEGGPKGTRSDADGFARMGHFLRSPAGWLLFIVGYVLYSRMWDLAGKVMHHDESLFAYYGYWLYRGNGYDYQPILHGPVLQFVSAFFFFLFGDSQWTMRLPSLVGGLLMLPVVWCWRRYIGGIVGAVAVFALIALSPSLDFYTRFLRNDVPYLTATMWCAYCLLRALQTARPKYVWGAIMAATLMFCMMESSIFFFAACIGYLITMVLADCFVWRRYNDAHRIAWPGWLQVDDAGWRRHWNSGKRLRWEDLLACFVAAAVLTLCLGWLYYRVFYATIRLYTPLVKFLSTDGITMSPRTANIIIAVGSFGALWALSLWVLANVRRPMGRYGLLSWFGRLGWRCRWHVIGGFALAVIVYTTLFTTFFTFRSTASFNHQVRDFSGPVKALTPVQIYQNTWDYWWDQHKLHRIKGPFHYYLPILFLYELPILVLAGLGWWRGLYQTRRTGLHLGIMAAMHVALAMGIWGFAIFGHHINWEVMDKTFHLTHPVHLFLILFYAQVLVYIAPMLYRQGRRAESFVTYWGVTSLFAYSYAGEKVPWLTVHTVGPFALLAATELVRFWRGLGGWSGVSAKVGVQAVRRRPVTRVLFFTASAVAVIYQVRNNYLVTIVHPWSPAERLVYNHTSPDIQKTVEIIEDIGQKTNFGNRIPLLVLGEMGWPLHWYLRDYSNMTAPVGESAENTSRPIVMVDWPMAGVDNIRQNYTVRRMKVREWWEPEMLNVSVMFDIFAKLTPTESRPDGPNAARYEAAYNEWRKLWHYLAYREIWIDPKNPGWSNGTNEFALCIRKDIDARLMQFDWLNATPKRTDVPVFEPY